jgi:transposase
MDVAQRPQPTVILAEDEASIYLQASNTYVWAARGQTPVVRVDTNRDCTHLYGSLDLLTGKEIVMRCQVMNSDTTAVYLNQILQAHPDLSILLLWDRASHHKGDPVKAVLQANPRLEVMWFPAGAPDTNPQEHVWKHARQHVCHGHTFTKLGLVADAVEHHLLSNTFPSSLLHQHACLDIHAAFI